MSEVDPYILFSQVPASLRQDREAQDWMTGLQRFMFELWERTGGARDEVGDATAAVVVLDGSVATLETATTALQTSVGALQTTVNAIATGSPTYAPTNASTDRAWDCNAAAGTISATPTQAEVENIRDALLELSDVVATIADDLETKGIFG